MLAALGVLAACGALVEDAGASWGAIYLSGDLHASAATAGLAVVALQVAMTIGRLTGDRLVDRFGQRTVVRAGGALAALGMGAALAVPTLGTTLAGFALAGLGVATLIPAAMHTADELPGLPTGHRASPSSAGSCAAAPCSRRRSSGSSPTSAACASACSRSSRPASSRSSWPASWSTAPGRRKPNCPHSPRPPPDSLRWC